MGRISVENVVAGMVLASAVHDRSGRLLMGSGLELTEKHLHTLRAWGIMEADIAGDSSLDESNSPQEDEISPELLKKAESELRILFRNNDPEYPPIAELFRLCLLRKVRNEKE